MPLKVCRGWISQRLPAPGAVPVPKHVLSMAWFIAREIDRPWGVQPLISTPVLPGNPSSAFPVVLPVLMPPSLLMRATGPQSRPMPVPAVVLALPFAPNRRSLSQISRWRVEFPLLGPHVIVRNAKYCSMTSAFSGCSGTVCFDVTESALVPPGAA